MSEKEQEKPTDTGAESTTSILPQGDLAPDQKPAAQQREQTADKIKRFFQRPKKEVRVFLKRSCKLIRQPKAWLEAAALITVVVYTHYAGQQSKTMSDTLVEIRRQTGLAQTQAETMQKQLEATDRAWVKVQPVVDSPITFSEDGDLQLTFTFYLKNVGHSVATNVAIRAGMLALKYNPSQSEMKTMNPFQEPIDRQKAVCAKLDPHPFTLTLYPDDPVKTWGVGTDISRAEMEARFVPPPPPSPGVLPPSPGKQIATMLFGCVDYQLSTLPKHHQTGFIYNVVRSEPQSPGVPFLIIVGQKLPQNRIRVERWLFGGDYAN